MIVQVLLSTYNGEKFLREQLDSLVAQKLSTDCDLNILVRDDGSKDTTVEILDEYKSRGVLDWYTGENLKPAKSFWDLLKNTPDADYYCFCDQDDVWHKDKVERAIKALNDIENQNQPLLYCSNVTVVDQDLKYMHEMNNGEFYYTDFAHSLIYSLAPGCTMVFNDLARKEMIKYDMDKEFEIIHDRLAHKIVAMLGEVIYDNYSTLLYRQHSDNVIGANNSTVKRAINLLFKEARRKSLSAQSLVNIYKDIVPPERLELLNIVSGYVNDKKLRKKFIKDIRFKKSRKEDFVLRWLIRFKKV